MTELEPIHTKFPISGNGYYAKPQINSLNLTTQLESTDWCSILIWSPIGYLLIYPHVVYYCAVEQAVAGHAKYTS